MAPLRKSARLLLEQTSSEVEPGKEQPKQALQAAEAEEAKPQKKSTGGSAQEKTQAKVKAQAKAKAQVAKAQVANDEGKASGQGQTKEKAAGQARGRGKGREREKVRLQRKAPKRLPTPPWTRKKAAQQRQRQTMLHILRHHEHDYGQHYFCYNLCC